MASILRVHFNAKCQVVISNRRGSVAVMTRDQAIVLLCDLAECIRLAGQLSDSDRKVLDPSTEK